MSTYYYACQHKNMLYPPQEGSNRSLAYGTLLSVYGRCTMPGSPMGWSEGLSRRWAGLDAFSKKHQEKWTIACF